MLHHRWSNHVSVEIKTGRPDRIKGGITLLFWLIDLRQQKKVASLPRSTVAEKKQISWLNLFIKHCYYHHLHWLELPNQFSDEVFEVRRCFVSLQYGFICFNFRLWIFATPASNRGRRKAKIMLCLRPCVRYKKRDSFFGRNVFRCQMWRLELWLSRFSYLVLIGGFIEFTFYGRSRWEVNKRHFERYPRFLEFRVNNRNMTVFF